MRLGEKYLEILSQTRYAVNSSKQEAFSIFIAENANNRNANSSVKRDNKESQGNGEIL